MTVSVLGATNQEYNASWLVMGQIDRVIGFDRVLYVQESRFDDEAFLDVAIEGFHHYITLDMNRFLIGDSEEDWEQIHESINRVLDFRRKGVREQHTASEILNFARCELESWERIPLFAFTGDEERAIDAWMTALNDAHDAPIVGKGPGDAFATGDLVIEYRKWNGGNGNDDFAFDGRYSPRFLEVYSMTDRELHGSDAPVLRLIDMNNLPNHISENRKLMYNIIRWHETAKG